MNDRVELKNEYLFTLIGIKETELTVLREQLNQVRKELQQANTKLQELLQKENTETE